MNLHCQPFSPLLPSTLLQPLQTICFFLLSYTPLLLCGANIVHLCVKQSRETAPGNKKALPCINDLFLFIVPMHQHARKQGIKKLTTAVGRWDCFQQ